MKLLLVLVTVLDLLSSAQPQALWCSFDELEVGVPLISIPCQCDGSPCALQQAQDDDMDWTTGAGSTQSDETGPDADHTFGNATGVYIFTEATNQQPGAVAALTLPSEALPGAGGGESCFIFWYHMFGQHIGSLNVTLSNGVTSWIAFSVDGNQGVNWVEGKVPLASSVVVVTIETARGGNSEGMPYGDIALDDLMVLSEPCNPVTNPSTVSPPPTTSSSTPSTTTTTASSSLPPTTASSTPSTTTTTASSSLPLTTPSPSPSSSVSITPTPTPTSTSTPSPPSSSLSPSSTPSSPTTPVVTPTGDGLAPEETTTGRGMTTSKAAATETTETRGATCIPYEPSPAVPGASQQELWGVNESLWIVILVILGVVILILLLVICIQACAMQRMRTAKITHQSDDYSNIAGYERPQQPNDDPRKYISAYDNTVTTEDETTTNGRL